MLRKIRSSLLIIGIFLASQTSAAPIIRPTLRAFYKDSPNLALLNAGRADKFHRDAVEQIIKKRGSKEKAQISKDILVPIITILGTVGTIVCTVLIPLTGGLSVIVPAGIIGAAIFFGGFILTGVIGTLTGGICLSIEESLDKQMDEIVGKIEPSNTEPRLYRVLKDTKPYEQLYIRGEDVWYTYAFKDFTDNNIIRAKNNIIASYKGRREMQALELLKFFANLAVIWEEPSDKTNEEIKEVDKKMQEFYGRLVEEIKDTWAERVFLRSYSNYQQFWASIEEKSGNINPENIATNPNIPDAYKPMLLARLYQQHNKPITLAIMTASKMLLDDAEVVVSQKDIDTFKAKYSRDAKVKALNNTSDIQKLLKDAFIINLESSQETPTSGRFTSMGKRVGQFFGRGNNQLIEAEAYIWDLWAIYLKNAFPNQKSPGLSEAGKENAKNRVTKVTKSIGDIFNFMPLESGTVINPDKVSFIRNKVISYILYYAYLRYPDSFNIALQYFYVKTGRTWSNQISSSFSRLVGEKATNIDPVPEIDPEDQAAADQLATMQGESGSKEVEL